MSDPQTFPPSKTMLKRIEQYRDRWSSYGLTTGIEAISDKMSPRELREIELLDSDEFDDKFLERISPDVSIVVWREGSVLFEQGTYIDLAFFILDGAVDISVRTGSAATTSIPIFDTSRTVMFAKPRRDEEAARPAPKPATGIADASASGTVLARRPIPVSRTGKHEITFLAAMDFNLPAGGTARLGPGEIFGEIGAMSGWPQSVTARTAMPCRLLQIRLPALRLIMRKSTAIKDRVDRLYKERALFDQLKSTPLLQGCNDFFLEGLKEAVELVSCSPDEVVVREGEPVDAIYLVRSGFVKLAQRLGDGDAAVSYLSKGMTLGEVELLIDDLGRWEVTASAVEYAELVKIPEEAFRDLLRHYPEIEPQLWKTAMARIKEAGLTRRNISHAEFTQLALGTGLVQGNSILVIDLERCTRCDDCVRACADTHGGRPRFVREGSRVDNLLVAKSCYHCRDPVCLVGCPTGAIHRAGIAAVIEVDDEICIGCSTCANKCPYDAIVMHETGESWPDDMIPTGLRGRDRQVASKCDLCHDTGHDPACVSNCPQGCAYRVGSLDEIRRLMSPRSRS